MKKNPLFIMSLVIAVAVYLYASVTFGQGAKGQGKKGQAGQQAETEGGKPAKGQGQPGGAGRQGGTLPPGLAKRGGNLPPGLQKYESTHGGQLPPGLEKQAGGVVQGGVTQPVAPTTGGQAQAPPKSTEPKAGATHQPQAGAVATPKPTESGARPTQSSAAGSKAPADKSAFQQGQGRSRRPQANEKQSRTPEQE